MKTWSLKCSLLAVALGWCALVSADQSANQTPTVDIPKPQDDHLPFDIRIEEAMIGRKLFLLPVGLHAGSFAVSGGKWLFIGGRLNGLHTFNNNDNNFPPNKQNRSVFVVDPKTGQTVSRSLEDKGSGLSETEIDTLAVTAPQAYQKGKTLYITGGYGVISKTGKFTTYDVLTAIDVPGLINWVTKQLPGDTAAKHIRQISSPPKHEGLFQVTGGAMFQVGKRPTLLILGQDFEGFYSTPSEVQVYTKQIRRFHILDDGKNLSVKVLSSKPKHPKEFLRRRDLNVAPIIHKTKKGHLIPEFVAYSGVFTPEVGIWTVPVKITANGKVSMANPKAKKTFKQGMNNYISAIVGLYSEQTDNMYNVILGGLTFGFFDDQGNFQTDPEIPFNNQVTTISLNKKGKFQQFLMNGEYPFIPTAPNPNMPLLFGADADFIPADGLPVFPNGVMKLDKLLSLKGEVLLGYIVGGIQSNVPNTETRTDSAASPYIFKVFLSRHQ